MLTKTESQVETALLEVLDNQPKENAGWDDFDFNVNSLRINPSTSKPDYDQVEGEYLFAAGEEVHGSRITKHRFKVGAGVIWNPHIHWVQSQNQIVNWQIDYKLWQKGATEPAWVTAVNRTSEADVYTSGAIHQITHFADINMSAFSSAAIHVKVRIRRIAGDSYTGDARFMGFDFHVPIDQPSGSRTETVK